MNDKELLELAAKAAGIEYNTTYGKGFWIEGFYSGREWDPLKDDGDALRLAVKLGVIVDVRYTKPSGAKYNCVNYWLPGEESRSYKSVNFDFGVDPCTATRRAIVRAAAEIGKAMAPSTDGSE